MERSVFDRLGQIEGEHWWFSSRRRILKSVIARFAPNHRPLRIMEAGCGTGGNLRMLSEFGSVDAFELDEAARLAARQKLPIDVQSGSLPDGIPFTPGSYDLVAALDVIEHVELDVESLRRLGEQLASGGRLIMTVPALPWLWSQHDVTHHHFRRYTKRSLADALAQAGLKPLRITYFNTLLFPLIAGVRWFKRAAGVNESGDDAMPSPPVNAALKHVFGLESALVGRVPLPIGVSLMAIAERRL